MSYGFTAFCGFVREIAEVKKGICGQTRNCQGGDWCRGSGNRSNVEARCEGGLHQFVARVIDRRSPSVRDQCHIPVRKGFEDAVKFAYFIVFEITGEWRFDLKVLEQRARVTGVFGGDQYRFTQNPHGARRHVFKISDRGGYKIKDSHAVILSPPLYRFAKRLRKSLAISEVLVY